MNNGILMMFSVTGDLLQYNSVILICEGLDTISNVSVNDRIVGKLRHYNYINYDILMMFSVIGDLLQYSSVILISEGLDTISNVSINGRIVGI